MNRFWLGVGLLLLLLGISITTSLYLDNIHGQITDILNQAGDAAISGDLDTATAFVMQAQQIWQKHWHLTALVIDHGPVDEIDGMFAQIEAYGQAGEMPEFAACCAGTARMVQAVGESHSLTWWNLF